MKLLDPELSLGDFFRDLARAPSRLLLLDYDGTLAPFVEERDQAVPYPGVRQAVEGLLASGHTRVVVVSGRAVGDLRPLLGIEPPPEMWGTHGWERFRGGGEVEVADPGPQARAGLDHGRRVAEVSAPAGAVEVKPVSIAVHVRALGETEATGLLADLRAQWDPIAAEAGLETHAFDGGLELRVPGRDKGTAVRGILQEAPQGTVSAYLGDDLTDEDAFQVLGPAGGLNVLVRRELREETAAHLWLEPPGELLDFLARWNEAAAGE